MDSTGLARASRLPQRIVCLTAESADILYALEAGELVVGVSGYTVSPENARRKPKVGAYTTVNIEKIFALRPDLVIAYSDLQADITATLARRGATVLHLNQRSLAEILGAIAMIGAVVGRSAAAEALIARIETDWTTTADAAARLPRRPRVYFEEWDDPLISGIRWVSEAIALAGGDDVFGEVDGGAQAAGRIVAAEDVVQRDPEIVFASWCGKKVRPERIAARPGWDRITAVREGRICEIKSAHILQPGPAMLTGMRQMADAIAAWASGTPALAARPA
ncbi:MAG: cobalamin-binding protein [Nitrospiria bacterium]